MKLTDVGVRVYRSARFVAREGNAWRKLTKQIGVKRALFMRIKENLSLDEVDNAVLRQVLVEARSGNDRVLAELAELKASTDSLARSGAEHQQQLLELDSVVTRKGQEMGQALAEQRQALAHQHETSSQRLEEMKLELARLAQRERLSVWLTWFSQLEITGSALVSVILPTHNRAALLGCAVRSVLAQSYSNWELVVIDDGSTDDTSAYLASLQDPRIRVVRLEKAGVCRARNEGLRAAKGEIIAYLDDDNVLHRDWLKATVWAFGEYPEHAVLYGARVAEKPFDAKQHAEPSLFFDAFNRRTLHRDNYIDMGSIAHRAGIPEAYFDESLDACVDWDLILRLTRDQNPLMLPAVSHLYRTSAPGRISKRARPADAVEKIRRKHRPPLRVLCYNSMYPLRTENYIGDETGFLAKCGLEIAYAREETSSSPIPVEAPLFESLEEGLAVFKPDALFIHWVNYAASQAERLAKAGLPYAVRVHSFDAYEHFVHRVMADPLCFGLWAYPHLAARWPGALSLPAVVPLDAFPDESENIPRSGVLVACAGLPKRNWPLLHDAFDQLPGIEKRIVIGTTNKFEHIPGEVINESRARGHGAVVQCNLDRRDVFRLMQRAAVVPYTTPPEPAFGMPMSVIEAMLAGSSVVVPDIPEARAVAGPHARVYRDVQDLVRHARECEEGGPYVEAERRANRAWALEHYCDPVVAENFVSEFVDRYWFWHERRTISLPPRLKRSHIAGVEP